MQAEASGLKTERRGKEAWGREEEGKNVENVPFYKPGSDLGGSTN